MDFAKSSTLKYYEDSANDYFNKTYSVDLSNIWNRMLTILKTGAIILDLGSGSGRDLRYFHSIGYKTIGIDYSNPLANLAKAHSQQPVVVGNAENLPFRDNSIDAVWAIASLLHLPRASIQNALIEIQRILSNNSLFIASMKKGIGENIDSLGRHTTFYEFDQWSQLLNEAGFDIVDIVENVEVRKAGGESKMISWIISVSRVNT